MEERPGNHAGTVADGEAALLAAANLKGIIAMSVAMACFAVGDTLMKLAATDLPTSELLFFRGLIVTLVSAAAALSMGAFFELKAALKPVMAVRTIGDVAGGWAFQSGLARMAYADITAITQLGPLAITAASALFLGEKVGWRRWSAAAVGLMGVLIIIRPGSSSFNWWALAGIASVLASTVRDLATRRIDRRVPPVLIMTLSAAGVTLAAGCVAPFSNWSAPSTALLLMLGTAGAFSLLGQLCTIVAMRTGEVSAVAPFRYTIIVFAIISGILVFGHLPDPVTLLGIVIVAGAGLYTFFREQTLRRLSSPKPATGRA